MANAVEFSLNFFKNFVSFMFSFDFGLGFTYGSYVVVIFCMSLLFRYIVLKAK